MTPEQKGQIMESLADEEFRKELAHEYIDINIALQLRSMRKAKGLNQSELASKIGKSKKTISDWENPCSACPSITDLYLLATFFDVALLIRFMSFDELIDSISKPYPVPVNFNKEKE
jgi:transcriptional regulator with XRE-family HTH domain